MGNRAGSQGLVELGERIRQRRKDSHLSQETFAEKAGISVNTVSRIEGGQTAMSIEIFQRLVEVLDADANMLLGRPMGDQHEESNREKMFCRILMLRPSEQKLVFRTLDAMLDGIESLRKIPQI